LNGLSDDIYVCSYQKLVYSIHEYIMAISPKIHQGVASEFLTLLDQEHSQQYKGFYFMLCGRRRGMRTPLFGSLVSDEQKINCRVLTDDKGNVSSKQWTLVLSFNDKNLAELVKTTREKEVVFECLFKNPEGDPKFTPVFTFPSLRDKDATYPITAGDLIGFAGITFGRGCIKVVSGDGGAKILVRLEEAGMSQ